MKLNLFIAASAAAITLGCVTLSVAANYYKKRSTARAPTPPRSLTSSLKSTPTHLPAASHSPTPPCSPANSRSPTPTCNPTARCSPTFSCSPTRSRSPSLSRPCTPSQSSSPTRKQPINTVLTFYKLQINKPCFNMYFSYIDAAKSSVSVCMPSVHNQAIIGRLMNLLEEKKIPVRILVDLNGPPLMDVFMQELVSAGAEIKYRVMEPYHLRYKFCLIDDEVLMAGTFDWGNDLSSDDRNYVYITNRLSLVNPVKTLFLKMWSFNLEMQNNIEKNCTQIEQVEVPKISLGAYPSSLQKQTAIEITEEHGKQIILK